MSNVWFISDLHGGHKNIIKFRKDFQSEEDHWKTVKENYHKVVTKRDQVYFLGDVCFTQERLDDLSSWTADKKILVLGNHCHASGTELLTANGWVPVENITEDSLVATVDRKNGAMIYEHPSRVVFNEDSELISINGTWVDDIVSTGHNILINNTLSPAHELIGSHDNRSFTLSCEQECPQKVQIEDDMIRLITWTVMDGTMVRCSERKTRIQFKLSKQRKIDSLETLLTKMNIKYTKKLCKKDGINKLQPYYIRIYGEHSLLIHNLLNDKKELPSCWGMGLNKEQTKLLIKTIAETDGVVESNKIRWRTTSKNDVDIVQTACVRNGIACRYSMHENLSGFSNSKIQYKVYIADEPYVRSKKKVDIAQLSYTGPTYGVTMSRGTTVARRNGKVWVTGNCTEKIHVRELIKVFDDIHSLFKYKEFWLSHAPLHPDELRGKINIHGHCHYHTIADPRYVNVCLEHTNYSPICLDEVRKMRVLD